MQSFRGGRIPMPIRPPTSSKVKIMNCRHKSISALQAAFRDPSSPYYIPPGTTGPSSPDPEPVEAAATELNPLEEAKQKLTEAGFDPASFWEQRIVWGDQDPFQCVDCALNLKRDVLNVGSFADMSIMSGTVRCVPPSTQAPSHQESTFSSSLLRICESVPTSFNNIIMLKRHSQSRIKWMMSLGHELGGAAKAEAMMRGQGISLILKSIDVRFRRPVTYPDTVRIFPAFADG
ncbi:hypothetical protein H0H81_003578 [Sphagnurus paluster]|uniref:Uncharacterized protein n=1 Tax=Sphagnurus paluster TaxID=117069 RepID=A0A9P7GLE9_9AGAR|nr:hypothetical protein H0H81_003578 [Sphagnurus paluster]